MHFMTVSTFQQHPLMPFSVVLRMYKPFVELAIAGDRLALSFYGQPNSESDSPWLGMNCHIYTLGGGKKARAVSFLSEWSLALSASALNSLAWFFVASNRDSHCSSRP